MSERQKATLKNWYRAGDRLCGNVYGHPRFEDGTPVMTSTIIAEQEGDIIKTRNTDYTLDGPPRWQS